MTGREPATKKWQSYKRNFWLRRSEFHLYNRADPVFQNLDSHPSHGRHRVHRQFYLRRLIRAERRPG